MRKQKNEKTIQKKGELGKITEPKVSRVGGGFSSWFWDERLRATTLDSSEDWRVTPRGPSCLVLGRSNFKLRLKKLIPEPRRKQTPTLQGPTGLKASSQPWPVAAWVNQKGREAEVRWEDAAGQKGREETGPLNVLDPSQATRAP